MNINKNYPKAEPLFTVFFRSNLKEPLPAALFTQKRPPVIFINPIKVMRVPSYHFTFPIYSLMLQTVFIQQKITDTHNENTVLIVMRNRSIPHNDDLFEGIPGQHQ